MCVCHGKERRSCFRVCVCVRVLYAYVSNRMSLSISNSILLFYVWLISSIANINSSPLLLYGWLLVRIHYLILYILWPVELNILVCWPGIFIIIWCLLAIHDVADFIYWFIVPQPIFNCRK